MSLIISIETSGKACSVALSKEGKLMGFRSLLAENYPHARVLHVFIDEILKESGIVPSQLSAVAVSSGPGSYTGLRIGVSAAKGLCYALDLPLIEISTLWLIAREARETDNTGSIYLPMIDARRMEVYTQAFDKNLHPLNQTSSHILSENSFSEFSSGRAILCGDGSEKSKPLFTSKSFVTVLDGIFPLAKNMCEKAHEKFLKKEFVDVNYFEPFYLKEFQSQSVFHKK